MAFIGNIPAFPHDYYDIRLWITMWIMLTTLCTCLNVDYLCQPFLFGSRACEYSIIRNFIFFFSRDAVKIAE